MSEDNVKQLFWYRVKFLSLVAVFLLPFVGGWLALYVFEWRPESGNYGQLVQPVQKVEWPALQAADGELLEQGFGRRWAFLLFTRDGCSQQCQDNIYYMGQTRKLLGRNHDRIQNVLVSRTALGGELREKLATNQGLTVIEGVQFDELSKQFSVDEQITGEQPRMYLVDPDNNLMMFYPAQSDHGRVLEDLRNLMRLSQIG